MCMYVNSTCSTRGPEINALSKMTGTCRQIKPDGSVGFEFRTKNQYKCHGRLTNCFGL